jgi:hypothetical protein
MHHLLFEKPMRTKTPHCVSVHSAADFLISFLLFAGDRLGIVRGGSGKGSW